MPAYPRVLYVEDDEFSRSVMQILLVDHMQLEHVAILEDSADFENRIAGLPFQPDLVFLDIHMKPISGFEMLKILRTLPHYANIPIVALTASVMNEEVEQLKAAKFNGVIAKPIMLDSFTEAFEQLLSGQEVWQIVRNR